MRSKSISQVSVLCLIMISISLNIFEIFSSNDDIARLYKITVITFTSEETLRIETIYESDDLLTNYCPFSDGFGGNTNPLDIEIKINDEIIHKYKINKDKYVMNDEIREAKSLIFLGEQELSEPYKIYYKFVVDDPEWFVEDSKFYDPTIFIYHPKPDGTFVIEQLIILASENDRWGPSTYPSWHEIYSDANIFRIFEKEEIHVSYFYDKDRYNKLFSSDELFSSGNHVFFECRFQNVAELIQNTRIEQQVYIKEDGTIRIITDEYFNFYYPNVELTVPLGDKDLVFNPRVYIIREDGIEREVLPRENEDELMKAVEDGKAGYIETDIFNEKLLKIAYKAEIPSSVHIRFERSVPKEQGKVEMLEKRRYSYTHDFIHSVHIPFSSYIITIDVHPNYGIEDSNYPEKMDYNIISTYPNQYTFCFKSFEEIKDNLIIIFVSKNLLEDIDTSKKLRIFNLISYIVIFAGLIRSKMIKKLEAKNIFRYYLKNTPNLGIWFACTLAVFGLLFTANDLWYVIKESYSYLYVLFLILALIFDYKYLKNKHKVKAERKNGSVIDNFQEVLEK